MENIVLQSAGSFSVAVLSLILAIQQVLLWLRKPQITWAAWSAGISLSGMFYAIGIFFEYNAPAGPVNRFAGLLEFTAIIFVIHCAYGFTFASLGSNGRRYHIWGGLFHALVLLLLWSTDIFVSHRFVSHDFLAMTRPFVESGLGPLGPLFELYGILASIGVVVLWGRYSGTERRNRTMIISGFIFWLAMAAHDGLASMGVPSFQYIMEYGFLGFSFVVLWVVFHGFEDISTLEKFRAVAEFSNDVIVMIQNDTVVFDNPAAIPLFGRQVVDGTIEDFLEAVVPEDRLRFMAHYRGLLDASELSEFIIIRLRRASGEEMILEIRAKRVDYRSQPAILAFLRDTTQRIRKEEGNFNAFFESMEDMIVVGKPDGSILHANTATKQKLGYTIGELERKRVPDLCPEKWRRKAEEEFGGVSRDERKIWRLPLETRSGVEIPAEIRSWFAMWNGADCVFIVAKDQTAEHDAKELLNRLFRNNPALMALFSMPEIRLAEVNKAFLAAFGYTRDEVIGRTVAELGLFSDPNTDEILSQAVLADGQFFNAELQARRKDGSVFDGLFSAEIIRHRGRRLLLCVMIDISARKQAERQLRQARNSLEQRVRDRTRAIREIHEQMVMQEKLASIGQLAAGIAHELNNPINFVATNFAGLKEHFTDLEQVVRAYRDLLQRMEKEDGDQRYRGIRDLEDELQIDYILNDAPALFEESQRGFDRIDKIIHSMRQFSHTDPQGKFVMFDINKAVENAIVIARNTYKYCARLEVELGAVSAIACLPEQIHQVLLNLIVNSAQAIESQHRTEKGKISVRTWQEEAYVACRVADDGPGIPDAIRNRIFEAFFTTKPAGKGSGLGLSLSYDIVVNKHGGAMAVDCPREGGTVFTFRIPGDLDIATASTGPEHAPSPR